MIGTSQRVCALAPCYLQLIPCPVSTLLAWCTPNTTSPSLATSGICAQRTECRSSPKPRHRRGEPVQRWHCNGAVHSVQGASTKLSMANTAWLITTLSFAGRHGGAQKRRRGPLYSSTSALISWRGRPRIAHWSHHVVCRGADHPRQNG